MTPIRSGAAIALSLFLLPAAAVAQTAPEEVPPEDEPAAESPAPTAGYEKGFFIRDTNDKGSFELKLKARVQTLATFDSRDAEPRDNQSQLQIRRARLTLSGHAFTKKLGYKFQTDFARGFLTLKDFTIDGEVADRTWIRAGQWKRPFSRQQISSSGTLDFVDRAITDGELAAGRDIGVALHNGYEKSPDTEWAVGVFNGQGDSPRFSGAAADPMTGAVTGGGFSNVPRRMMPVLVARFGVNRGGIKGYAEPDLEGGGLRWAAAASAWIEADFDDSGFTRRQAEVDFLLKSDGLSVSGMVAFARVNGPMDALDQNTIGAHLQVGKVLGEGSRRVQPAVRYAMIKDLTNDADADEEVMDHEITAGLGWFIYGHDCKLQLDVGSRFSDGGGPGDRVIGRLQLNTGF